jgi:hypothetical protein
MTSGVKNPLASPPQDLEPVLFPPLGSLPFKQVPDPPGASLSPQLGSRRVSWFGGPYLNVLKFCVLENTSIARKEVGVLTGQRYLKINQTSACQLCERG